MDFQTPVAFGLLLLLPLLLIAHLFGLPGRQRGRVRLSSLGLLTSARDRHPWRRHVPGLLVLAGLGLLTMGAARPVAEVAMPAHEASVVLVLDVSGSMSAEDIKPSRLEAARSAALGFLAAASGDTRIGLVLFSEHARLLVAPTTQHHTVRAALNSLEPEGGTALGDAIVEALRGLHDPVEVQAALLGAQQGAYAPPTPGAAKGIVLLTDGESNAGVQPQMAAAAAALLGVPVFPIGLGTSSGVVQSARGDAVGVAFDEATLQKIARATGGEYWYAPSRQEVERVFGALAGELTWRTERVELGFLVCAVATPLLLLGAVLSHVWTRRFP